MGSILPRFAGVLRLLSYLVVLGGVVALIGGFQESAYRDLKRSGLPKAARVVRRDTTEIRIHSTSAGSTKTRSYNLEVAFRDVYGKDVRAAVPNVSAAEFDLATEGGELKILYDPADTTRIAIEATMDEHIASARGIFIGAGVALAAGFALRYLSSRMAGAAG